MTERSTIEDPEMSCDVDQLYNYRDFENLSKVGLGGFSLVYVAEYKNTGAKFAIKKLTKGSTAEINKEIKLTKKAGSHSNIIGFYGITRFEGEENFSLVLEYADGGTLGKYLRKNVSSFKWESQFKFAKEIAGAILWIHDRNIIHRDLNSNNVLIHKDTTKLADFGRSCLQGSNCRTKPYGVIPYMDPNIFENHTYDLTEKSDIYSLGVLLWELTSRSSPFNFENLEDFHERERIKLVILGGKREDPIPGTNHKFVELYQKCWESEPDKRPDIHQVMLELNDIGPENNVDNIDSESSNNASTNNSNSKETEVLDNFADCHLQEYN